MSKKVVEPQQQLGVDETLADEFGASLTTTEKDLGEGLVFHLVEITGVGRDRLSRFVKRAAELEKMEAEAALTRTTG